MSVFFLTDTPKYLFTPHRLAVVFAMLASYGLSRTLVPIMIDVLVAKEYAERHPGKENQDSSEPNAEPERPSRLRGWFEKIGRGFGRLLPAKLKAARQSGQPGFFRRFHNGFERGFEKFRASYLALVTAAIDRPVVTLAAASGVLLLGGGLLLFIGQDYFPQISSSTMTLHVRTRPGTRIETATEQFAAIENAIKEIIPDKDLDIVLDNIGLPASNYNLAFNDGSFVAYNDGQILDFAEAGARFYRRLYARLASGSERAVPRHRLLLPTRRHHHADSRFWQHHPD